jgi:hypothetical protein
VSVPGWVFTLFPLQLPVSQSLPEEARLWLAFLTVHVATKHYTTRRHIWAGICYTGAFVTGSKTGWLGYAC